MATPVYNAAWRRTGHGSRGRTWGVVTGSGSILGGNTPRYLGAGQPAAESGGSLLGNGTPVYLAAPKMAAGQSPSMMPSMAMAMMPSMPPGMTAGMTANAATAPQPSQVAIVVPRS